MSLEIWETVQVRTWKEEGGELANRENRRRSRVGVKGKMIHRKWSLLTGPVAVLGSIVGAVVVANYLFIENVCLFFSFLAAFMLILSSTSYPFFFPLNQMHKPIRFLISYVNFEIGFRPQNVVCFDSPDLRFKN